MHPENLHYNAVLSYRAGLPLPLAFCFLEGTHSAFSSLHSVYFLQHLFIVNRFLLLSSLLNEYYIQGTEDGLNVLSFIKAIFIQKWKYKSNHTAWKQVIETTQRTWVLKYKGGCHSKDNEGSPPTAQRVTEYVIVYFQWQSSTRMHVYYVHLLLNVLLSLVLFHHNYRKKWGFSLFATAFVFLILYSCCFIL